MGAYILRYPQAKVLTLLPLGIFITTVRVPAFFFLGFWFAQQALSGLASLNAPASVGMESGGVAYWAMLAALFSALFSALCWDFFRKIIGFDCLPQINAN